MFTHRGLLAATLTALLPVFAFAGCAAPSADESVDDSEGAFMRAPDQRLGSTFVLLDPSTSSVLEEAFFNSTKQGAMICEAFLDGTDADKHACDAYPTGYTAMPCSDAPASGVKPPPGSNPVTVCRRSASLGSAPFTHGNGHYQVHFVSKNAPTSRQTQDVTVTLGASPTSPTSTPADYFQLEVDARDLPAPSATPYGYGLFHLVDPGSTTEISRTLRITIDVSRAIAGQVLGCATGFSTVGLTPAEVAQKDAQALADCANPSAVIQGRDGWVTADSQFADRLHLFSDASAFVTSNEHIIFTFGVNGTVRSYIFAAR